MIASTLGVRKRTLGVQHFVYIPGVRDMQESFGKWLKRTRELADISQSELARRAGVSKNYISGIEGERVHTVTGAKKTPRVEKVDAIGKALGVPISEARLAAGYAPPDRTDQELTVDMILHSGYDELTPEALARHVAQLKAISAALLAQEHE